MGEARFESERTFTAADTIGVVICRTDQGNLHAGMLYVDENDIECVLHLGWEDYLGTDWGSKSGLSHQLWASPPIDETRLDSIAGLCQLILERHKKDRKFPYALQFLGSHFSEDGRLVVGDGARGLTCATFILAVFRSFGIDLIDEESWECRREEDLKFLLWLSSRPGIALDHFSILRSEVNKGAKRIQPHEVLQACTQGEDELPVDFASVQRSSYRLLERLLDRVIADRNSKTR